MQIAAWAQDLLDFCYPGACASCESPCGGNTPLCEECYSRLRALEVAPSCHRCGMPVAGGDSPCPRCLGGGLGAFEKVFRLGVFHDPLKHLIHQIKYHARWTLAEFLADRLIAQERVKGLLTQTDRIMSVPLHPLRQMSRGYNQSRLVAKRLARKCGIKLVHPILRLRNTETQTHLHSKEKRFENLREAFGLIGAQSIRDRHVVVVDDVLTTGATLQSVARTLKEAKPACLCAIVLAVADPNRRDFEAI